MIKHYFEAIYLPMFRSSRAKSINLSNTFDGWISVFIAIYMIGLGFSSLAIFTDYIEDILPLDAFTIAVPAIIALDLIIKLIFCKGIDNHLITYMTLPLKRRGYITFSFARLCCSIEVLSMVLLLLGPCFSLIAPTYGYTATFAWLIIFYVWSIINSIIVHKLKYLPYGFSLLLTITIAYTAWAFITCYTGFATLPIRALSEYHPSLLLLVSVVMFFVIKELYIYIVGAERYAILEKRNTTSGWGVRLSGLFGDSHLLKLRIRMLFDSPTNGITLLIVCIGLPLIGRYGPSSISEIYSVHSGFRLAYIIYLIALGVHTFNMESNCFDRLSTLNIDYSKIVRTDFFINIICISIALITDCILNPQNEWLLISMALFYAGPMACYTLFASTFIFQKVDWSRKGLELKNNNQHYFAIMLCILVPSIFIPMLVYNLLSENSAIICFLAIGVAFVLTYPLWTKLIADRFLRKKYKYLSIYRDKF